MYECTPIGTVHTPFETPGDAPRQGSLADAEGELVLEPRYTAGLERLESGDGLDVIWFADQADRETLRIDGGRKGVFSSRSQDRPNPICITRCEVLAIDENRLGLRGVDMLDGTPVLDLKVPLRAQC
jgi:tRNA-Thr(GGU) m(6)t(6)A37 methyltransferase TsaA